MFSTLDLLGGVYEYCHSDLYAERHGNQCYQDSSPRSWGRLREVADYEHQDDAS